MKSKYIKVISFIIASPIFILSFFFGMISNNESIHLLNPYIDTEFAENYTPERFDLIKVGMTKIEVEKIIGNPYTTSYEINTSIITTCGYTQDGRLNRIANEKQIRGGDYAWYRSSIEFGEGDKVKKIDKGWSYD